MKNKSFFKDVMLFQDDSFECQGFGILMWMMILLITTCIILSIWLLIAHPDKFEEVMRMWGLWLGQNH